MNMADKKPMEYMDGEDADLEEEDDNLASRKTRRQKVEDDEMSPEEEGFLEGAESAGDED